MDELIRNASDNKDSTETEDDGNAEIKDPADLVKSRVKAATELERDPVEPEGSQPQQEDAETDSPAEEQDESFAKQDDEEQGSLWPEEPETPQPSAGDRAEKKETDGEPDHGPEPVEPKDNETSRTQSNPEDSPGEAQTSAESTLDPEQAMIGQDQESSTERFKAVKEELKQELLQAEQEADEAEVTDADDPLDLDDGVIVH